MRCKGHEVVVFSTAYDATKETSFDHPNIPSLVNPFNLKNRIGYNPGVKLAWYLGAYSWDIVHVVYPSLISIFVLPLCAWRRIPVYCSHHVEMEMFARKLVPVDAIVNFGLFMYNLIGKWPAKYWGTLNAAPTLCFAREHLGKELEPRLRQVPSGTHDVFTAKPATADERETVRRSRFGVHEATTKVILMVQRLSGEKGTERVFPAFLPKDKGGQGVDGVLVIAGDGPAKKSLMEEAEALALPVVFLGNVPHHELPRLYRASDCFVTMSLSETFGLTCLEAQMCGCPAVMPFCSVFDEIWSERVPKAWRYDIASVAQLASSMKEAQATGRKFLEENPVQMTWADASTKLLAHYEECIAMRKEEKDRLHELIHVLDHCLRIVFLSLAAAWILSYYYKGLRRFGSMVSPFSA
jgi:glycosyltransferase involved in cell wall biosynthesis